MFRRDEEVDRGFFTTVDAACALTAQISRQYIEELFNRMDCDQDGFITVSDLIAFVADHPNPHENVFSLFGRSMTCTSDPLPDITSLDPKRKYVLLRGFGVRDTKEGHPQSRTRTNATKITHSVAVK